jgi:hypothetical protein
MPANMRAPSVFHAIVGFVLVLVLAACVGESATPPRSDDSATGGESTGSSTGAAPTSEHGTMIEVTESEFSISLSQNELLPGTYMFDVRNAGQAGRAAEPAQAQAVGHHEHAGERHRRPGDQRVEQPERGQRQRGEVVQVALDRAQGAPGQPDRVHRGPQVAADQGEIAGFDGNVGAGATTRPSRCSRVMTSTLSMSSTSAITSSMPTSAATASRAGRRHHSIPPDRPSSLEEFQVLDSTTVSSTPSRSRNSLVGRTPSRP